MSIGVDYNGWADVPETEREALDTARAGRRQGRPDGRRSLDSGSKDADKGV